MLGAWCPGSQRQAFGEARLLVPWDWPRVTSKGYAQIFGKGLAGSRLITRELAEDLMPLGDGRVAGLLGATRWRVVVMQAVGIAVMSGGDVVAVIAAVADRAKAHGWIP